MNARSTNGRRPLHVLIAGGGVAGLEALLGLRHHAQERVSIELLAPEPQFWYRPLSVAEPFGLGRVHGLDLSSVADECGALFTLGGLRGIDTSRGTALTSTGAELDYDALLIAVGARPVESVPGAFTFRGPADSAAFGALLDELGKGKGKRVVFALPDAVFAAGDATPFPIKQGGLATQQADAAAEAIAGLAGADVVAQPFRPVLRGLILTGGAPLYARAELSRAGNPASVATDALWWPPGKIVGRYLAPYLAERSGAILDPRIEPEGVPVEADLSSLASAK